MRYYTIESLGLHQQLTPEGYLLVKDVRIARTGVMLYAAGEVPVTAVDGVIRIERAPEDVFADATLASFEGKPVTLDHPTEDVNPANWSQLAKGVVQNVRRGAGLDDEFLVADLLITDADAIRTVRAGLREVSCGYDADYEELEPGRGRQMNIIGNHLALVENGRCGSRCAIGDSSSMKKKIIDRLRAAFKARDEAAFEQGLSDTVMDAEAEEKKKKDDEEEENRKTADARFAAIDARFDAFGKALDAFGKALDKKSKDEDEEESEEEKKKREDKEGRTGDSAGLAAEARDAFARAEILSPGISMPTFDAKATPAKTRDALCALKRKALTAAYDGKFKDAVSPFGTPAHFQSMTCDALQNAFIGASEIVRRENNEAASATTFDAGRAAKKAADSIADINKRNQQFWDARR